MSWLSRLFRSVQQRSEEKAHRDELRREALEVANQIAKEVLAAKQLRELLASDKQYGLRMRGTGRR